MFRVISNGKFSKHSNAYPVFKSVFRSLNGTHHLSTSSFSPSDLSFNVESLASAPSDGDGKNHEGFQKWRNGGGIFHNSACIDPTALVEVGAVVHAKATLAANVFVGSGTVVGPGVAIGRSTKLEYNVGLSNCTIGDSCIIHHGVCIGQDGFGFFVDVDGKVTKKPQIAHNVVIGRSCMLCGQAGIAGSATIGDYVVLGGRAAVRDHISITSRVRLAANSCVTKDIMEPGDYGGFPAVSIREWRRLVVYQRRASRF